MTIMSLHGSRAVKVAILFFIVFFRFHFILYLTIFEIAVIRVQFFTHILKYSIDGRYYTEGRLFSSYEIYA
jgi:hypothetical protein